MKELKKKCHDFSRQCAREKRKVYGAATLLRLYYKFIAVIAKKNNNTTRILIVITHMRTDQICMVDFELIVMIGETVSTAQADGVHM